MQDFMNMYFKKIYKPIPLVYNLVLAMLWRHPENVELEKVKVVHYCAAVSYFVPCFVLFKTNFALSPEFFVCLFLLYRVRSRGDTQGWKRTWRGKI